MGFQFGKLIYNNTTWLITYNFDIEYYYHDYSYFDRSNFNEVKNDTTDNTTSNTKVTGKPAPPLSLYEDGPLQYLFPPQKPKGLALFACGGKLKKRK